MAKHDLNVLNLISLWKKNYLQLWKFWFEYEYFFRYDFVLNAKEKSEKGVYQMRFGGLYDCSNLKAHGLGLLIYDNIMTDLVIIFI